MLSNFISSNDEFPLQLFSKYFYSAHLVSFEWIDHVKRSSCKNVAYFSYNLIFFNLIFCHCRGVGREELSKFGEWYNLEIRE